MKAVFGWSIAVALGLSATMSGCTSTGKRPGSLLGGIKGNDKSLRAAVEKDPFPRAQAVMAASNK